MYKLLLSSQQPCQIITCAVGTSHLHCTSIAPRSMEFYSFSGSPLFCCLWITCTVGTNHLHCAPVDGILLFLWLTFVLLLMDHLNCWYESPLLHPGRWNSTLSLAHLRFVVCGSPVLLVRITSTAPWSMEFYSFSGSPLFFC